MAGGDVKEISVNYADDYPDKVFAGAKLKYKCTVKEVKEQILPEVNDAFAKTSGEGETVLELRINIRKHLTIQKEEEQARDHKNRVIEHVTKQNEVSVPKTLVDDYIKNVTEDFKKQYKDQPVDEAEIRKNYEPVGSRMIRWSMLFHRLAQLENIEVQPEDIEKLISKFAENYKITPEQAKESLQQSGNISELRETLLEDKVVELIISKAKLV